MKDSLDKNMHPNAKYYDKLSTVYDRATEPPGAWTPPEFLASIIASHSLNKGKVLDIGIGTGRSISAIYEAENHDIVGVDCSPGMLKECSVKYPDITLLEGRFEEVDLSPHQPFDLIICCGVFEFVEDLAYAISKAADLLTPNGNLLFTYEPLIEGHEIQKELKSSVVPSLTSAYFVEDFYAYRHRPSTIRDFIRDAGLRVKLDEEFVSYRKLETSIIYHCILASR